MAKEAEAFLSSDSPQAGEGLSVYLATPHPDLSERLSTACLDDVLYRHVYGHPKKRNLDFRTVVCTEVNGGIVPLVNARSLVEQD